MKNLKFGVLVFGALGVVGLMMSHWTAMLAFDKVFALLMMAGFVLPTVMGVMGLAKPPFQRWQAGVAAAGFALVFIKGRMWEAIKGIGDVEIGGKLVIISCLAGLVISIICLAKPEET